MSEGYYKTKESVDEYIKLAEGYNGGELIKKLKDFLPSNSYLLELGSGPGTDWNILNEDFNVVGSDNSPEFLKHLITNIPNGEFLELDATTLNTVRKFDGIYSNKVLHHLNDEELETSIKRQYEVLNPRGIICHSFWQGEGSEIFHGMYVNYHSIKNIEKLFMKFFEILLVKNYQEFDKNDSILFIGKKK